MITLLLLILLGSPATADVSKPRDVQVSVNLRPNICQEPCTVNVAIKIRGVQEGDSVCIGMDNGSFATSSCWPHTGRLVSDVRLKNIPDGTYQVYGTAGGRIGSANLLVLPEH